MLKSCRMSDSFIVKRGVQGGIALWQISVDLSSSLKMDARTCWNIRVGATNTLSVTFFLILLFYSPLPYLLGPTYIMYLL